MSWAQKLGETFYKALVKLLENAMSKKFLVFITATTLLAVGILPPTEWIYIALAVLGVTSAIDFKNGSSSFHHESQNTQAAKYDDSQDIM